MFILARSTRRRTTGLSSRIDIELRNELFVQNAFFEIVLRIE